MIQCFGRHMLSSSGATLDFMPLSLNSGGGSGIGRAVCQRFASEGASVVVADISEESANETLESLTSDLRGQGHMATVVDVSSKESVKKLVTSIQVCVQVENTPTHTVVMMCHVSEKHIHCRDITPCPFPLSFSRVDS